MPYPRLEATHYIDYWKSDLHPEPTYFWSNEYIAPIKIDFMCRNIDNRLTVAVCKIKFTNVPLSERLKNYDI